jgi:hypothetical protein
MQICGLIPSHLPNNLTQYKSCRIHPCSTYPYYKPGCTENPTVLPNTKAVTYIPVVHIPTIDLAVQKTQYDGDTATTRVDIIDSLLTLDKRSIVKQGTLDYFFALPGHLRCFVNKRVKQ